MQKEIQTFQRLPLIFIVVLFVAVIFMHATKVHATAIGLTNGTYDFGSTVGPDNSGGSGLATFSDKFVVSNGFSVAGTQLWSANQIDENASGTLVIKAEGTTTGSFTFKDLGISSYDPVGDASDLSLLSVNLKDSNDNDITTLTNSGIVDLNQTTYQLSHLLNGGAPYTYNNVAKITISWDFVSNPAPSNLNFDNITISNVSAPTRTISALSNQTLNALTAGYASGTQGTKTVTVTRTGTGDLASLATALSGTNASSFTITQPAATTLNSGIHSTTFTVKAKDGLPAGTYTATVSVSATSMTPATFTVTQVVNPPPTYTIGALSNQTLNALTTGYASGTQETKTVTVTRTGTGNLASLATALSGTNASSFTVTQPAATTLNSGTPSTTFTVKAKDGLPAGTYSATVTVSATSLTPVTFTVTQVVNTPTYTISALSNQTLNTLTEGYASGTQDTKTMTVTRTGTGNLASLATALSGTNASSFTVTQPAATTLGSGTPSTTFTVKAKDGLPAGTYMATVTVSATNMTSATFTVTQVVNIPPTYTIGALSNQTLNALTEGYASGTQETGTMTVIRTGTGDLVSLATALSGTDASSFTITQPAATTLGSGTPSTSFTVKANDGLAAGTYSATVTVSATSMTPVTFTLTQVVDPAPLTYTIDTLSDLTLNALTEGYASAAQETRTVTVTRTGTGDLASLATALSGTNASSFTITQPAATTLNSGTPSTTFTVKANDGLVAGTYTATVTVSATNMTPVTFTVTQVVDAPPPTYTIGALSNLTLNALTEGYASAAQETRTVTVTRTGTGDLASLTTTLSGTDASRFTITQSAVTTLNSGTPSTTFTVKAIDVLAAGTYTATVTVSATNMTPVIFTVTQVVDPAPPTYTIGALSNLTLNVLTEGYASGTQETKTVTVNRTGTGDLASLTTALSGTDASRFTITQLAVTTLNSGTPSTTFTAKSKDGLPAGTYTATITVSATIMTPVTFTVTQVVDAAPPTYTIAALSNLTLNALTEGYASGTQETRTVTVTRTGTGDLASLTTALSGTGASSFTITQPATTTLNNGTPSTTFTVKAKDGLPAGTYTATVTVSGTNMIPVTFVMTQLVSSRISGDNDDSGGGSTSPVAPSLTNPVIGQNSHTLNPDSIDTTMPSVTLEFAPMDGVSFVSIPASSLTSLEDKNAEFIIEIKAPYGSYQVPVHLASLIPGLADILAANNLKAEDISFKIMLTDKSKNKDNQAAFASGLPNGKLLGAIVDFHMDIVVTKTGQTIGMADMFSKALIRIIPMPKNMTGMPEPWGAFRYNEATQKFEFVAATKEQIDGEWIVRIRSYSNSVYVVAQNTASFNDVQKHWSQSFVELAAAKGLVDGVGDSQYAPDQAVTRAEFTTMLVRALGRGTSSVSSAPYVDVMSDAWYFDEVAKAQELGLLTFVSGNSFKPDQPLTREEMASMLAAVLALEKLPITKELVSLDNYKDIGSVDPAYLEDVRLMVKLKIMTGNRTDAFSPKSETTRAQAAVVFIRTLQALGWTDIN